MLVSPAAVGQERSFAIAADRPVVDGRTGIGNRHGRENMGYDLDTASAPKTVNYIPQSVKFSITFGTLLGWQVFRKPGMSTTDT
jgi:hypothetical protein